MHDSSEPSFGEHKRPENVLTIKKMRLLLDVRKVECEYMKKRIWSILIVFCMIIGLVTNMQVMSVSASNTAGDLVSIAQGELGNGCSKYTHYVGSINGSYNYAWCAAFVSWCGNQAGVSCIGKTASCYAQYQYMTSQGGSEVSSPQAGYIVLFYYGN